MDSEAGSDSRWLLTGFYGNPNTSKRKESWALLNRLNPHNRAWCVMGCFSEILFQHKKKGGRPRLESKMSQFRKALICNNLFYIKGNGDCYTWSNKHDHESFTKERLDRLVTNQRWKELFSDITMSNTPVISFDRKPLLISLRNKAMCRVKKKIFGFETGWLQEEECSSIVKYVWDLGGFSDSNSLSRVHFALSQCSKALYQWNKNRRIVNEVSIERKLEKLRKLQ